MINSMNKKFWIVLGLGIVLRLVLSLTTYHSDIQPFDLAGYVLSHGYILDYYDFLPSLSPADPILKVYPTYLFNYPPIVYFFLGAMSIIFTGWSDTAFHYNFIFNVASVLGTFQTSLHLFLLKLPYFAFDLGLAFLLIRLFQTPKEKFLAFTLWILNPVNLYATYMMGQFDIIPAFFVILALFLARGQNMSRKNIIWAGVSLGLGGCFKIYPLFLLVPFSAFVSGWKNKILVFVFGFLPYILMILPFLPSKGFRTTALVAGQTLKSLYAQIPISGGESILLFLALLVFFYLIFFHIKTSAQNLWQNYFIILLLFFIFTHYHPQWFLWLTPFFVFALIRSNFKDTLAVLASLFSFVGLIFFFDPGLSIGLFSPLNPSLYNTQSIWQILKINIDYNFARSILQTIFVGAGIYFIYRFFPKISQGKDNF